MALKYSRSYLLLAVLFHCTSLTARTWQVIPTDVLQKTIDKASARDTILIAKGTYRGAPFIVDKALVLIGKNQPILDGENKGHVLSITASGVQVHGISAINSGKTSSEDYAAIKVIKSDWIRIENCRVENAYFGIYLEDSEHSVIRFCEIIGTPINENSSGNAIHAWKCDSIRIENNRCRGHRDGIYFEFVENSEIIENVSEDNIRYGLHFMFSHHDNYLRNVFLRNGCGVAVMFSRNVRMIDNDFEENWGSASYGLLLKEITDSELQGNNFLKNTIAIYMEGCNRTPIHENLFQDNGWGIKIQASCADNTVTQNNFMGNSFDVATNGSLVMNTFDSNYWDKYEGYDLNKDGSGDQPFHPCGMFAGLVERMPNAIMLYRSFIVALLEKVEKIAPSLSPVNFVDKTPRMKPVFIQRQ